MASISRNAVVVAPIESPSESTAIVLAVRCRRIWRHPKIARRTSARRARGVLAGRAGIRVRNPVCAGCGGREGDPGHALLGKLRVRAEFLGEVLVGATSADASPCSRCIHSRTARSRLVMIVRN